MCPLGLKMLVSLVAFSGSPSEVIWLEKACFSGRIFSSRQVKSLGLKMLVSLVAFSEPPSEAAWLENAPAQFSL
jgi:hypothetical protein